jgi:sugar transferase (PEP-CTERM/EpsH1 system associated)
MNHADDAHLAGRTEAETDGMVNPICSTAPSTLSVVHVVLSLDIGGLERVVLNLARQSSLQGQRVAIVCLERPGVLAAEVRAAGVALHCVEKQPGIRLRVIAQLARLFRILRPDVIHTHQVGALLYAGLAARAVGVPVVVHTEHGRHYARQRRRWLGRMAGRMAARFFCVSREIAGEVIGWRIAPRAKVAVLPNGIDLTPFAQTFDRAAIRRSFGIPADVPVIGSVGRLVAVKRQDRLIRALAELAREQSAAHLLLVGDGPLLRDLRALAAQLGLADRVHFAGYQPVPARCLAAMDVFALTSDSEGMPLALLEAWAARLPVVASRVGSLPDLIDPGATGLLFAADDASGLVEALAAMLENRTLARELGDVGRRQVEARFTLARMREAYQGHYRDLLVKRRTTSGRVLARA